MFISFLNVFIVPVISVSVLWRRFGINENNIKNHIIQYCNWAVIDNIAPYIAFKILQFYIGICATTESQLYTIVSACLAFILPYFYEVCMKYTSIKCEIKEKD